MQNSERRYARIRKYLTLNKLRYREEGPDWSFSIHLGEVCCSARFLSKCKRHVGFYDRSLDHYRVPDLPTRRCQSRLIKHWIKIER